MTPEYLADFFDGEGSLTRVTNSWRWRVAITQGTSGVLYDVRRMTGIGQVRRSKLRNSKWSPSWVFTVNRQRDVLRFLRLIAPHVVIKRELIDAAVGLRQRRKGTELKRAPVPFNTFTGQYSNGLE